MHGGEFEEDFQKIEKAVTDIFKKFIPILKKSDKEAAAQLIHETYWMLKRCDEIVDFFFQEENRGNTLKEAASRALYTRYLKRIAAHLLNIASSVVNPFEQIGFMAESK